MGDTERYLAVGAALFVLGAIGFITRRNLIMIMLSAELMLHGVSLSFVTFARLHHSLEGQVFTIFVLTVAACEAGLALALILALFQTTRSLDIDLWSSLREPDLPPPPVEQGSLTPDLSEEKYPRLTPAGRAPLFVDAPGAPHTATSVQHSRPVTSGSKP